MQNPFDVKKLLVEAMTGSRIPNPTLNNIKNCLVRIYKDNPAYAVRDEDAVVLKEFNYYDRTIVSIVDGIDFVGDVAGRHCFVEELPYKQNGFLFLEEKSGGHLLIGISSLAMLQILQNTISQMNLSWGIL